MPAQEAWWIFVTPTITPIPSSKKGLWMPKHKAGTELHPCTCGASLPTLPRVTPTMGMLPTEGLTQQGIWGQQGAEIQHTFHVCTPVPGELSHGNSMPRALLPAQDVTQALLTQIRATSFCGTCTHTTTALKGSLKWPVKYSVFSSYANCFYYMKKKKKKVKNLTLLLAIKLQNNGSCLGKSKKESNGSHAAENLSPQLRTALHLAPHNYYLFLLF